MAFAGLCEYWIVPEGIALPRSLAELEPGDSVQTCMIPTTVANKTLSTLHHRMSVILPPTVIDPWLDGQSVALDAYPTEAMAVQAVATWVNKASSDKESIFNACRQPRRARLAFLRVNCQ